MCCARAARMAAWVTARARATAEARRTPHLLPELRTNGRSTARLEAMRISIGIGTASLVGAALLGCTSLLGDFDVSQGEEDAGVDGSVTNDARAPATDAGLGGHDAGADVKADGPLPDGCASSSKVCDGGCVPIDDPTYGC